MAYQLRKFQGRIVRLWRQKGYGFVAITGGNREAHFHLRDCDFGGDQISVGSRLEFFLEDNRHGLSAIRVSKT